MSNIVTRMLHCVEARVASKKVNSGLDTSQTKYSVEPDVDYAKVEGSGFDHSDWDSVLRRHVSAGEVDGVKAHLVDYCALGNDPKFDLYRSELAGADLDALQDKPNELLALYINAYNALCIGHIVRYMKENGGDLPPSIKDIGEDGTEIWDADAGIVGGEKVTLNDVEHGILRSRWAEPRIHASIVCASASCPNLRREAFVASKLNEQMDDQAKEWVSDPTKGVWVEERKDTVTFSRIFLWFKDDFAEAGGPVAWARRYLPEDISRELGSEKKMDYFTYNWSLNKTSNCPY